MATPTNPKVRTANGYEEIPFRSSAELIKYSNSNMPGVENVKQALDSANENMVTKEDLPIEYGTWMPILRGQTTPGIYTYTSGGSYTRIGDMVFYNFDVSNTQIQSAGTGLILISGLPFVPSIVSGLQYPVTIDLIANFDISGVGSTHWLTGGLLSAGININASGPTLFGGIGVNNIKEGFRVRGGGFYRIAK